MSSSLLVILAGVFAGWIWHRHRQGRAMHDLAELGRWGRDVAGEVARTAEAKARLAVVRWCVSGVLGLAGIVTGGVVAVEYREYLGASLLGLGGGASVDEPEADEFSRTMAIAEHYATAWGLDSASAIHFSASDTNSTGWNRWAGVKKQPCGGAFDGEVPTVEAGTTPSGDNTFTRISWMGVQDQCSGPYFQFDLSGVSAYIVVCYRRMRFEIGRTYDIGNVQQFIYKGPGPQTAASATGAWNGHDLAADNDTTARLNGFFDQGQPGAGSLRNHLNQSNIGADSLVTLMGADAPWVPTVFGWDVTNRVIFFGARGWLLAHTDSAGTSYVPNSTTFSGVHKDPHTTLGGGVLPIGVPGDSLTSVEYTDMDFCQIWHDNVA